MSSGSDSCWVWVFLKLKTINSITGLSLKFGSESGLYMERVTVMFGQVVECGSH